MNDSMHESFAALHGLTPENQDIVSKLPEIRTLKSVAPNNIKKLEDRCRIHKQNKAS
jgi:hypothetical protein